MICVSFFFRGSALCLLVSEVIILSAGIGLQSVHKVVTYPLLNISTMSLLGEFKMFNCYQSM